jgi:hypothetical protein
MKRNKLFSNLSQDGLLEQRTCIAFHEAGHAAAIYLNNKARNLSPAAFQIIFKDLNEESGKGIMVYQVTQNDCIARVTGGRAVKSLPSSIEDLIHKHSDHDETTKALEIDIINLLIGPLAEAKYIAETDDELFSRQLIGLGALQNYGGSSDLELVYEYLQCISGSKEQQSKKLAALYSEAFNFIADRANWAAITKLANYILDSNKNIIDSEEVAELLGK